MSFIVTNMPYIKLSDEKLLEASDKIDSLKSWISWFENRYGNKMNALVFERNNKKEGRDE